jgi:hypothetical protein
MVCYVNATFRGGCSEKSCGVSADVPPSLVSGCWSLSSLAVDNSNSIVSPFFVELSGVNEVNAAYTKVTYLKATGIPQLRLSLSTSLR